HGGEIKSIAENDTERTQPTCLSRERGRECHTKAVFREIRRGNARGALGGRSSWTDPPPGWLLRFPPRPDSGGGLCAHPRRRAPGGTPSDWPSVAGEHDGGWPCRTFVRCCKPTQSGCRTADRPGREMAGSDARPACRARGEGVECL